MTDNVEDLRRWRLPRGRHGLPRELVTRSQRERLLAAMVRVAAAKGYGATTVADILEHAGVGRESFYELFDDKRDCMLAAHSILVEDLEAKVRAACEEPGEWADRLQAALATALEWFAADPSAARFTLVELGAVGTVSRARFQATFESFVSILDQGRGEDGPDPELAQATRLAVSAIIFRIYEEVVLGRAERLPALLPSLTFETLVPYLGEDVARDRQRRAAAAT